jgi:hypothetical protein
MFISAEKNYFILEYLFERLAGFGVKALKGYPLHKVKRTFTGGLFNACKWARICKTASVNLGLDPTGELVKKGLINMFSKSVVLSCESQLKKSPKILYDLLVPFDVMREEPKESIFFFTLKRYYLDFLKFMLSLSPNPFAVKNLLFSGQNTPLTLEQDCSNVLVQTAFVCVHGIIKQKASEQQALVVDELAEKFKNSVKAFYFNRVAKLGLCTILLFYLEASSVIHPEQFLQYNDIVKKTEVIRIGSRNTKEDFIETPSNETNKGLHVAFNQLLYSLDLAFKRYTELVTLPIPQDNQVAIEKKNHYIDCFVKKIALIMNQLYTSLDKATSYHCSIIMGLFNCWVGNLVGSSDKRMINAEILDYFLVLVRNLIQNRYFKPSEAGKDLFVLETIDLPGNAVVRYQNKTMRGTFNNKILEFFVLILAGSGGVSIEEKQELLGRFQLGDVVKHCVVNNNVNGCFLCARLMLYFLQFNVEAGVNNFSGINRDLLRYSSRMPMSEIKKTHRLYTLCTTSMILSLIKSSANIKQIIVLLSQSEFNEDLVVNSMFEFRQTLLRDTCMANLLLFAKTKGRSNKGKTSKDGFQDPLEYMAQVISVTSILQGWGFVCQTLQCNNPQHKMQILKSFCGSFSRRVHEETNILRRLAFLKSLYRLLNFLSITVPKQILENGALYKEGCGRLQQYVSQTFGVKSVYGSKSGTGLGGGGGVAMMDVLKLNNFQILSKMVIQDVVSQVYMNFDLHSHYLKI